MGCKSCHNSIFPVSFRLLFNLNNCVKIAATPFCQHNVFDSSNFADSPVNSRLIRHAHHQEMFRAGWQNPMVNWVFSVDNSGNTDHWFFSHYVVSPGNIHKGPLIDLFHRINITLKHDLGMRNLYSIFTFKNLNRESSQGSCIFEFFSYRNSCRSSIDY